MATIVYIDGTLTTGLNNGTSWENAYRGCSGLQTALDNVVDGADTIIYIRNTFSIGTYGSTIDIDAAGGDYMNNHWLKIIGCDSISGNPLAAGQYVTLDGQNTLAGHIINISYKGMIWFENIQFANITAVAKAGCYLTTSLTKYGFNFINCKFTALPYGIYTSSYSIRNLLISQSEFISNATCDVYSYSPNTRIQGCYFEGSVPALYIATGGAVCHSVINSKLASGTIVAYLGSAYGNQALLQNCTVYSIGTAGITAASFASSVGPVVLNNIIHLAQPASDTPISAARISLEDYNCTNTTVHILTGFHSLNGTDPQFIDAANGDFRPRNPLVLRGGMPDITNNPTQIGAIQSKYQFISKARAANLGRLAIIR